MAYLSHLFLGKFYYLSSSRKFIKNVLFLVIAYISGLPLTIFRLLGFLLMRKLEASDIC